MVGKVERIEELGFVKRWVAFLDFLGFRELVAEIEKDPQKAEALLENLRSPRQIYDHLAPHFTQLGKHGALRITGFSDSIVISAGHPYLVIHIANSFYALAMSLGLFIRGGIAVGTLYHDDEVVLGSAMIRAYLLESQVARVPRVVIDDAVVESLEGLRTADGQELRPFVESIVSTGDDGFRFLDPFTKDPTIGGTLPDWRERVRGVVTSELASARTQNRPDLISKFRWLQNRLEILDN